MKTSLKNACKKYFGQQQLSDSQLDTLEAKLAGLNITSPVETEQASETKVLKEKRTLKPLLNLAAVALVSMITLFLFNANQQDLGQSIAEEVVTNHMRFRPLEVESTDFFETRAYFTKLDFNLRPSKLLANKDVEMLGGRYCSIKSLIAAQLRYQDNKGKPLTLYQVGYDKDKFGKLPSVDKLESPLVFYVDGFKVMLWNETGLLMATVETL
jgi:hypothetical protein